MKLIIILIVFHVTYGFIEYYPAISGPSIIHYPEHCYDKLFILNGICISDSMKVEFPESYIFCPNKFNIQPAQSLILLSDEILFIPRGLCNCANLTNLQINASNLNELQQNVFEDCSLNSLHIDKSNFKILPASVFKELHILKHLSLQNNRLESLDEGVFNGLNSLLKLEIKNTQLSTIYVTVFEPLKELQSIEFVNNKLKYIDAYFYLNQKLVNIFIHESILYYHHRVFDPLQNISVHLKYADVRNENKTLEFLVSSGIQKFRLELYSLDKVDFSQSNIENLEISPFTNTTGIINLSTLQGNKLIRKIIINCDVRKKSYWELIELNLTSVPNLDVLKFMDCEL